MEYLACTILEHLCQMTSKDFTNVNLLVPTSLLTWWVLSGSVFAVYKGKAHHRRKSFSGWQKNSLGVLSSWSPLSHLYGRERRPEKRWDSLIYQVQKCVGQTSWEGYQHDQHELPKAVVKAGDNSNWGLSEGEGKVWGGCYKINYTEQ